MPTRTDNTHRPIIRQWIAALISGGEQPAPVAPLPADADAIIECSETEGTTPLLHHAISRSGAGHQYPPALEEKLRSLAMHYSAAYMAQRREFESLVRLFNDNGLDFVVLKGEALACRYYDNPYLRTRGDFDLLFRDKQSAENAWCLLEGLGYSRNLTLDGRYVGFQFTCWKEIAGGMRVYLDIHNRISDYVAIAGLFSFDEILRDSSPVQYGSGEIRIPDPVFCLVHACLHRISNRPSGTENRLIWLYDIHLICRSLSDSQWKHLEKMAGKKQIAAAVKNGLDTAVENFATPVPAGIDTALAAMASEEDPVYFRSRRRWLYYWNDLKSIEGSSNKLRFVREHFFPSLAYMRKKYGFGSPFLLPVYYIKRLTGGFGKYFRSFR